MIYELDSYILDCLSKNMTILEMQEVLNKKMRMKVSNHLIIQKLRKLKNLGYLVDRNLTGKGIELVLAKSSDYSRKFHIKCLQFLKFIVISDTHIGNIYDRVDLLNNVYDYAVNEEIHFVFHCGDLIEGIRNDRQSYSRFETTQGQLDEVIGVYPKRNDVYTGLLLGNHDLYSIEQIGFDIRRQLEDKRLDIITLGYISSSIKINNRNLILYHDHHISSIDGRVKFLSGEMGREADIVFGGHCHEGRMLLHNDIPFIFVSPLFPGKKCNRRVSAYECKIVSKHGNNELDAITISPLVVDSGEVYPITNVEYKFKDKVLVKKDCNN